MRTFVLISLPICPVLLSAATTGTISGTITDPSGGVIPGVAVVATNPATGVRNKTVTDGKGFYDFPSFAGGRVTDSHRTMESLVHVDF